MKRKLSILIGLITCMALYAACKKGAPVYVSPPPSVSIFGIVKVSPGYSLFREALQRTGVDSLLDQPGSYTLLLPDNNAFAEAGILRDAQIDSLDTAYLHKWVLYHILNKAVLSAEVPVALQTPYLNLLGDTLYFSQPVPGANDYSAAGLSYTHGTLNNNIQDLIHVNGDTMVSADTRAANGYIDVMSSPLQLPAASVQSYLVSDTSKSIFVAALKQFGLFDQLTGPGPFTILAPTNAAFLQWGMTADSIGTLDTADLKKYLFGVYVLTPHLFFQSDLWDGPDNGGYTSISVTGSNGNILNFGAVPQGAFFSPDGILVWMTSGGTAGFFAFDTLTYKVYGALANGAVETGYYLIGPAGPPSYPGYYQLTAINNGDRDHITHNGVVHGINNILVYPDSVKKQ